MSVWTWVFIGCCAAGATLPLVSAIVVLRLASRIRARANELQNARLFTSLESLQLQSARLRNLSAQAAPLLQRARNAVERIRAGVQDPEYGQVRDALQSSGEQIRALFQTLR